MDERDQRITALGAEVERLRGRLRDERQSAEAAGRAQVVRDLFDLVDDCDRLIAMLGDNPELAEGIAGVRERIIQRFGDLGYRTCGQAGEIFDPEVHEALDTEPGLEPGRILFVYGRGWVAEDGTLVRAARVRVSLGEAR